MKTFAFYELKPIRFKFCCQKLGSLLHTVVNVATPEEVGGGEGVYGFASQQEVLRVSTKTGQAKEKYC